MGKFYAKPVQGGLKAIWHLPTRRNYGQFPRMDEPLRTHFNRDFRHSIDVSPDGKLAAIVDQSRLIVLHLKTGDIPFVVDSGAQAACFTADSARVLMLGAVPEIIDAKTGPAPRNAPSAAERPTGQSGPPQRTVPGELTSTPLIAPGRRFVAAAIKLRRAGTQGRTTADLTDPTNPVLRLRLTSVYVGDEQLEGLPAMPKLQSIEIACTVSVTSEGLKQLKRFPRLASVTLQGSITPKADLSTLAEIPSLRHIHLARIWVTGKPPSRSIRAFDQLPGDEEIARLARIPQLESLQIDQGRFTSASLEQLKSLSKLKSLKLDANIDDAGLVEVAQLQSLESLTMNFDNGKISPSALESLEQLTQLKSLHIQGAATSKTVWPRLASLKNLESLTLLPTLEDDAGVEAFAKHPKLKELHLLGSQLTDAGAAALAKLPPLVALTVGSHQITDDGLKHIAALKSLRSLRLGGKQLTDAGLKHLVALKDIETLSVRSVKITNAAVATLREMPRLRNLALREAAITDEAIDGLSSMKQLVSLELVSSQITNEGALRLHQALPNTKIDHSLRPIRP
jgi:Leucine-rich repeat (LRR) protein